MQKKKFKKKEIEVNKHYNEVLGIFLFGSGLLLFFSIYYENLIGVFGVMIKTVLLGLFGLVTYVLPIVIFLFSIVLIFKNQKFLKKYIYIIAMLLLISSLNEIIYFNFAEFANMTFVDYITFFFQKGVNLEGGGILGGIISFPFLYIFNTVGSFIIISSFLVADIILITNISIAYIFRKLRELIGLIYNKILSIFSEDDNDKPDGKTKKDIKIKDSKKKSNKFLKLFNSNDKENGKELKKSKKKSDDAIEFNMNKQEYLQISELDETDEKYFEKIEKKSDLKLKEDDSSIKIRKKLNPILDIEYKYPNIDLLSDNLDQNRDIKNLKNIAVKGAKKLEETLESFGVEAKVINICRGPAVTRYELQPSPGVKVSRIVSLTDDICLNLAASGIRIEAPIPGKAAVGIEVPNKEVTPVFLREVIESPEFTEHSSKLSFALGKNLSGESVVADIAKMPHLLVAGATGSGKSVCINSLIISLLFKTSPNDVKLLMIDPKVVELGIYNGIPHLLIPVVTDMKKAASALSWAVTEMVNRYKLFANKGVRDIKGYNAVCKLEEGEEKLPQIVIIIDELADLMMVAPNNVEDAICRLAQMARAAGMHLVIATQRPSVDVITGVIKANIPSRIAFAVSSQVDSRTILDMAGAEKLLGKGDMLFYPVGEPKPIRVKGAFVTDKEVETIVEYIKSQTNVEYDNNIIEEINNKKGDDSASPGDNDEFLPQAIELVVETGQASASLLQRKFKVGYARAARIVDQMEARGIIGKLDGSKPRQVLVSPSQWLELKLSESSLNNNA